MNEANYNYLEQLKFKNVGDSWIGKHNGYFFKVIENGNAENTMIVAFSVNADAAKGTIVGELDSLQGRNIVKSYTIDDAAFRIVLDGSNPQYTLVDFLNAMTEKLSESGAHNSCESCGKTSFVDFYTNQAKSTLLCGDCYRNLAEKIRRESDAPNNYLTGFLGSLVGALIGSVAWIAIGAVGFYASIAGYAIAFAAFKGYEMGKGKKTSVGIALNVVSIVAALAFAQYAGIFIEFVKEYPGLTVPAFVLVTPDLFADPGFLKALLPDIGLGLLFAVLGTYRTIKNNYQSAAHTEKLQVEKVAF